MELVRIKHGRGGDFTNLKRVADSNSESAEILNYLAQGYNHFDMHREAAKTYEIAAGFSKKQPDKIENLKQAAINHQLNGDLQSVEELANKIREEIANEKDGELVGLKALHEVYAKAKWDRLDIGFLERIAQIDPTDIDLRFSLALKHSVHGSDEASLHHYLLINGPDRSPGTWNNIGVSYSNFRLPIHAVRAYRKSQTMSDTLAMSNLAQQYTTAGFLEEARALCAEAVKLPAYDTHINAALTRIADLPELEAKNEAEILERARRKSDFYQRFGRALSRPTIVQSGGAWRHPKCDEFTVELSGSEFRAVGWYTKPINRLATALSGGTFALPVPQRERVKITYAGILHGSAVIAAITKDDGRVSSASLLDVDDMRDAMIYMSEESAEWCVM